MGKMYETLEVERTDNRQNKRLALQVEELNARNRALLEEVHRLEVLCDHDAALHILNRRGLDHALESELSRARRYGVVSSFIYLDLDHFKPINDRYGHGQGDHVLKKLAEHINSRLRKSDHFARLGGDEFAIILAYATPEQAHRKIDELARSVAKAARNWGPGAENLTFSAGISEISGDLSAAEIIQRADKSMYSSKAEKAAGPE